MFIFTCLYLQGAPIYSSVVLFICSRHPVIQISAGFRCQKTDQIWTHLIFKLSMKASRVTSWRRTKSPMPNSGPSWMLPAIIPRFHFLPVSHFFLHGSNHPLHILIVRRRLLPVVTNLRGDKQGSQYFLTTCKPNWIGVK